MTKLETKKLSGERQQNISTGQVLAQTVTSPECLSASVLTICQNIDHSQVTELVGELKKQSAATNADDLSRAEGMLTALGPHVGWPLR